MAAARASERDTQTALPVARNPRVVSHWVGPRPRSERPEPPPAVRTMRCGAAVVAKLNISKP